ncbi:hypothetical protein BCU66_010480 [Vibrio sp. 10N.286.49.B1]|nr:MULTISPECIES: hypothetical protein [unclassified Vibrio]
MTWLTYRALNSVPNDKVLYTLVSVLAILFVIVVGFFGIEERLCEYFLL